MTELEKIIDQCLGEELPYCQVACPLHIDVQGYVKMIKQGNYEQALRIIRRTLPFPAIMGRVCTHPCESACKRADLDEPLALAHLKRAASDHGIAEDDLNVNDDKQGNVAVVGGGPAGIMASHDLRKMGYRVTIFEALPFLGGMLAAAIPDFRLPRDVVTRELAVIERLGVTVRFNTKVGRDVTVTQLEKDFDAIVLATGAALSRRLKLNGLGLQGVYWGLDFLRAVKSGNAPAIGQRVTVIGGGNVAIDVGLSAVRLGAREVSLVCLESLQEMPASPSELKQALAEGVAIKPSLGITGIIGQGKRVTAAEIVRCTSVFNEKGKFQPVLDESHKETYPTDIVILAIGQETDLSTVGMHYITVTSDRLISVDPVSMQTSRSGFFACGDVVTGPSSVIEALAAGRRAACSVDRHLRGEDLTSGREADLLRESQLIVSTEGYEKRSRCPMPFMDLQQRRHNFNEVELGYSTDEATAEAERCLECQCKTCIKECEFLKQLGDSPKTLARKLKEGFFRQDRRLVYRCNVCDLCKRNCDKGLSLGDMFMELRQTMVKEGLGPLPEHQFVVRDQNFATSDKFTLVHKEPGVDRCETVFFPGCSLSGYSPELVMKTYEHLLKKVPSLGVVLGCCGGPTRFLGDESRFRDIIDRLAETVRSVGAKELIVACPDCYHTFRHCEHSLNIRPLTVVLLEHGLPDIDGNAHIFTLHDSCKARWEPEWQDSARALMKVMGYCVDEFTNTRDKTRCCGLGGMVPYADNELAARITKRRADEARYDIATYCASCREALAVYKPTVHLLDLIFNPLWETAKSNAPKTGKMRRENQARLKQLFLDRC